MIVGLKHVLPKRLAHWFAMRLGIYLFVAVLTGVVFVGVAGWNTDSSEVNTGHHADSWLLGVVIVNVIISLLHGVGVGLWDKARDVEIIEKRDESGKVVSYIVRTQETHIVGQTIAFMLRAIVAGASPAAAWQLANKPRPPQD